MLRAIGASAGAGAMYQAMIEMGYAANSDFTGPIKLNGDPKGSSVIILGAGLAGMVAAYEMRKAGYKVQILEYNDRPGGRNWTLYGGDSYTELGGYTQKVQFAKGQYFNTGPWRIPHHHAGILHYCKLLKVQLESFVLVNNSAFVHSTKAFGGKPKRYREVVADFDGYTAELLAKATSQDKLDDLLDKDEKHGLLQMLKMWGALDKNYEYKKSTEVSDVRGYQYPPGAGLDKAPVNSEPMPRKELLKSDLWLSRYFPKQWDYQGPLFQPVGGMGVIGKAFGKLLDGLIKYSCKVTNIHQDDKGVTVTYSDTKNGGVPKTAKADWCVCTIPASILSQIPMTVGPAMRNAVDSLSYIPAVKVGLQFKRRFWEQDEAIFGGITYTDQPIFNIAYPSHGAFEDGPGVLIGAYAYRPGYGVYDLEALSTPDILKAALEQGAKIHPQYTKEYQTGVAVAWHRVPWSMGCSALWSDENRAKNYNNLCAVDNRIVLAGEHASRLMAWQEGSVLSALDAIKRLHQRVMSA
ncbi:MAG: flavin monoamine oxidase family protein [Pseudomonadota bacterium]